MMNDPWDVKCVTQSNRYVSCMKINGVPLLPPLLSKECRKEMQYYKVLAKEVEKRISILKPYVNSDSESEECSELNDIEKCFELPQNEIENGFDVNIEKITAITTDAAYEKIINNKSFATPIRETYTNIKSNITVKSVSPIANPPKLIIDLSLNINETGKNILESIQNSPQDQIAPLELPEHDYDYKKKPQLKEKELDVETIGGCARRKEKVRESGSFKSKINDPVSDPLSTLALKVDGPSSLSSKSFTGSLNDIRTDNLKESQPKLIRQSSYTLLEPSPQLLAHLEVQSIQNGVDMISISMSESQSSPPNKKRRSWDLETAKVKWSSMAMQLNQTTKVKTNGVLNKNNTIEQTNQGSVHKPAKISSPYLQSRSVAADQKRNSLNTRVIKTEPITKPKTVPTPLKVSPPTRFIKDSPSPQRLKKDPISPKNKTPLKPEPEDPAVKVRELYEKIQQQQLAQMASLMDKQKREQLLLQQAFESQNSMLFKQLKTICPKSPVEVKEAWGDKCEDRGPVSLSQLINQSQSSISSPLPSTIAESSSTISNTNRSTDLKNSNRKTANVQNCNKIQSPQSDGSRTRTHSPNHRNASRKLNYESSASERDFDNILTDRTNDTMADIMNVSFPSDSDELRMTDTIINRSPTKRRGSINSVKSTDSAIRTLENSIHSTMNSMNVGNHESGPRRRVPTTLRPPTVKERAAATKIVAYAKGYLLRRLMRTERVQSTVQTIRDALLCALQLHQDREGIRGADVDLHRRLIQQITAACYTLHDTCVASTAASRCAIIAADRQRRRDLANRIGLARADSYRSPRTVRQTDIMTKSHSGSFPARIKRMSAPAAMSQSCYETYNVRSRVGRARR